MLPSKKVNFEPWGHVFIFKVLSIHSTASLLHKICILTSGFFLHRELWGGHLRQILCRFWLSTKLMQAVTCKRHWKASIIVIMLPTLIFLYKFTLFFFTLNHLYSFSTDLCDLISIKWNYVNISVCMNEWMNEWMNDWRRRRVFFNTHTDWSAREAHSDFGVCRLTKWWHTWTTSPELLWESLHEHFTVWVESYTHRTVKVFTVGVDRLSAWPIIGADIKHFTDYRYRPFSKQICR